MGVTDPWAPDTPALLAAGPLTHAFTAQVVTPTMETVQLLIVDGTLTFDETRSPRCEVSVTAHLPNPTDVNSALARTDPRDGCRLQLWAGYVRPDGAEDVQQVADVGLRSRSRNRPDDTLTLVGRGDENLVIDNAPSTTLVLSSASTRTAIADTIKLVLPAAAITTTATTAGPAVSMNQPDADKWNAVLDFAARIGAQVYDNGLRAWVIADRIGLLSDTPAYTLKDGETGTLVEVSVDTERDGDWYNRVLAVNEWTDAAGVPKRIVAVADATGRFAPAPGNTRVIEVNRDTPTVQAEADKAATTMVASAVTRGRVYRVVAPSAYWIRPGHTVAIQEAGRDEERHLVTGISYDMKAGLMTIDTRSPDTGTTSGTGRWVDVNPAVTWDRVDPGTLWDNWRG